MKINFLTRMMPFIIAMCALCLPAMARGADTAPSVLTLREFIDGAILHTPEIFRELARIREAESAELQAKAVNDIVFDLHYNKLHETPYTKYSSSRIQEQDTDNAGAGFSWISPWTGTRVRGGVDYNRSALRVNRSLTPVPDIIDAKLYNPEAYIEVQQPLLKNWLGMLDRFPVRQAELNRLIMRETVDESIETVIADLYNLYFSWYLAWHQQDIYAKNVKNGEDLVATVANKFANGLSDVGDVARARIVAVEYAKARDLAATRLGYLSQKVYRWCYNRPAQPGEIIEPEKELVLPARVPENFSIYSTRQMKILNLSREVLARTLERDRNALLPDLNLSLSYRARNYALDGKDSLDRFPYPVYSAGAALSYPLQNSLGEGRVEETRAILKRWEQDLRAFERNYSQSVDELRDTVRAYETVIRQDEELIAQAGVQLAADERKYLQGQSDLYFVIQDRNALLNYELIRITDRVDARRILVQLLGLMDEIKKDR
ncbi:MAG: TolC family protein [Spirochaetes bacterium]|nr:MAG: TolC family protein [Spirochaetota bacterium]